MSSTENNYVNTDLGNVALNSCGEYNADSSYEYLDTVNYEGGSYFCKVEFPKKISGIAPKAGVSTEFWQLLTIPGDATSEYIKLHDEVVNKAKQVETSRAAVELSQTEVEAAQADVSQMRQDTQEAAEEAASSRDSAAGYAQSAETSRTAAKESEDNINAQVTEFDTHVAEKTSAAETAVGEARKTAIDAITTQQDASTKAVTDEGTKQTKAAIKAVTTQQNNSVQAIADEASEQIKKIKDSLDKGLSEEGKAADAKATGEAISKLTEDLSNKITKFYASNQGETHITDSDNGKIQNMMIYGKSSQDETPTPENPAEIERVVNPTVKVTNEDGLKVQSVTLNNITLNAIPVSSGGNVTIDRQQYIADYVDVERGELVKRVYEYVFSDKDRWLVAADGAQYMAWRVGDNPGIIDSTSDKKCLCSCLIANILSATRKGENYISTQSLNDTCRVWVSANVATSKLTGEKVFLALIVPEEISLTQEEIRAFKELAAYYPVTNVNVASEQLNGYTVFNYPVSMKNGWNYVKQQLNDNRDYIYDMDLQSAEAYVNSEYAVALTGLEV